MRNPALPGSRLDQPTRSDTASVDPTKEVDGVSLDRRWIVIGVVLGTILVSTLVTVARDQPPRPDVAILIGGLTFVLTGVLLGYRSPGETVGEAAVAGAIVAVLGALVLTRGFGFDVGFATLGLGWLAAVALSTVGGWVGEVLQGTLEAESDARPGVSWPWVLVGTVLGVVLNGYSVFVVNALLQPPGLVLLFSFATSFVLAGLFVGYASPGVTIVEPAVAGLLIVAIDWILVIVIFGAPFPFLWIPVGSVFGFLLALAGGAAGEGLQSYMARQRAGAPLSAGWPRNRP